MCCRLKILVKSVHHLLEYDQWIEGESTFFEYKKHTIIPHVEKVVKVVIEDFFSMNLESLADIEYPLNGEDNVKDFAYSLIYSKRSPEEVISMLQDTKDTLIKLGYYTYIIGE